MVCALGFLLKKFFPTPKEICFSSKSFFFLKFKIFDYISFPNSLGTGDGDGNVCVCVERQGFSLTVSPYT